MVANSLKLTHDALRMIEYDYLPSVLLVADSADGLDRSRRGIAASGCRVIAAAPFDEVADGGDLQTAADAVMLDIERDHGMPLDRLVDRVNSAAQSGRSGGIIAIPAEMIDRIAAIDLHGDVEILCSPSFDELVATVRRAAVRPPPRLNDIGKEHGGPARLQQLSEEVGRIASILASLSADEATGTPEGDEEGRARIDAAHIRAMIRARRLRDHFFRRDLFADPAWDMLLDLMAARLERQRVAVSSLCIAAAVPPTTALRWIKTLCDQGLFVRVADPEDGRRVFIELSQDTASSLEAYLRAAQRVSSLVV